MCDQFLDEVVQPLASLLDEIRVQVAEDLLPWKTQTGLREQFLQLKYNSVFCESLFLTLSGYTYRIKELLTTNCQKESFDVI